MIPLGRPDSVTTGDPLKPFWPVADTVKTDVELPAAAVTVIGETAMLKFWPPPVCMVELCVAHPARPSKPKHKTIK